MTETRELTHDSTLRELSTADGVLRYHEAGDGPPLLLLHGSGPGVTGWRNFRGNLRGFAEHFRCLVLEFPGFGVSDPTDEHPMMMAPESVGAFLDGLGLDRSTSSATPWAASSAPRLRTRRTRPRTQAGHHRRYGTNIFSPGPG